MPSDSPLEFLIDRSLGRHIVTDALREAGATVHPMAEVDGERIGQGLADTEWLHDAGTHGWVVLMKDDKIRYRPAELEALIAAGVRAFCVTNANLGGRATAERLVRQLATIVCDSPLSVEAPAIRSPHVREQEGVRSGVQGECCPDR